MTDTYMGPDACAEAIASVLTPVEKEAFLATLNRLNPAWRGAGVVDYLDNLYATDAQLDVMEPLWSAYRSDRRIVRGVTLFFFAVYAAVYAYGTATPGETWPYASAILDRLGGS